jgi:hypothetical protein
VGYYRSIFCMVPMLSTVSYLWLVRAIYKWRDYCLC